MRKYTYNGATHSVAEWSRITGISHSTLYARLTRYDWTMEQIMTIAPSRRNSVKRKGSKRPETQKPEPEAARPLPKSLKNLSLDEVASLAKERGMSYGRFVSLWQ